MDLRSSAPVGMAVSDYTVCDLRESSSKVQMWHIPIEDLFEDTDRHVAVQLGENQEPTAGGRGIPGSFVELAAEILANASKGALLPAEGGTSLHAGPQTTSNDEAPPIMALAEEDTGDSGDGQIRHEQGDCKPCIFHFHGCCPKGADCPYCHVKHRRRDYKSLRLSKPTRERLHDARQMQRTGSDRRASAHPVIRL